MSGIEVVGLVLGVIPLVFSAVDFYSKSASQRFIYFKASGILKLRTHLLYLEESYISTIEIILRGITTNDERAEMVSKWGSDLWKSQAVKARIEGKLGSRYSAIMNKILEIQEGLESVAKALSLVRSDKDARNELHAALLAYSPVAGSVPNKPKFEFKERLKLVVKGKALTDMIEQLQNSDWQLERLAAKANDLAEPHDYVPQVSFLGSPDRIEKRANVLYHAVQQAWGCPTHPSHRANLLLEHRMANLHRSPRNLSRDKETVFELLVEDNEAPTLWRSVEVTVLEEEERDNRNTRVRFSTTSIQQAEQVAIDSLCSAIASHNATDIVCFNLDESGIMRKGRSWNSQREPRSGQSKSLEELLSHNLINIGDEDRYTIAATIASSYLQLHRTPWTSGELTKRDIFFLDAANTTATSAVRQSGTGSSNEPPRLRLRQPFVVQQSPRTAPNIQGSLNSTSSSRNDEQSLLSLATVLLEIRLGRVIEHPQSEDRVKQVLCLEEWMWREQSKITPGIDEAIRFCMRSWYTRQETTSKDARRAFMGCVLVPIFKELAFFQNDPL